jgi:hypothetical protein
VTVEILVKRVTKLEGELRESRAEVASETQERGKRERKRLRVRK